MTEILDVVCWRWHTPGYRSTFGPETVNVLRNMVRRWYPAPHRFSCITDDAAGIDRDIRIIPLPRHFESVPNPGGPWNPSCYRRLWAFSDEAAHVIGPRFVSLDLDCVIVGDLRPLWDRPEDFVIWGDTAKGTPYNGSMWLHRAGTRQRVWDAFDPTRSPAEGRRRGYIGSDQAWIAVCLGPDEAKWTARDGVYSFGNELKNGRLPLPADARVVMMHGKTDPWDDFCQSIPWIRAEYR